MKTFEQIAREYFSIHAHENLYEELSAQDIGAEELADFYNEADRQWREELGKDRGVKSYQEWLTEKFSGRYVGHGLMSDFSESAWTECEKLWRHKALNIEQASQMKIAILERQIEELQKKYQQVCDENYELKEGGCR